jgi:hypothetical protein
MMALTQMSAADLEAIFAYASRNRSRMMPNVNMAPRHCPGFLDIVYSPTRQARKQLLLLKCVDDMSRLTIR